MLRSGDGGMKPSEKRNALPSIPVSSIKTTELMHIIMMQFPPVPNMPNEKRKLAHTEATDNTKSISHADPLSVMSWAIDTVVFLKPATAPPVKRLGSAVSARAARTGLWRGRRNAMRNSRLRGS